MAAGVANVVIFHAIKLVGPTRITALQSLVPAMAVVLAAIFLGEPIRPGQIVGGVDHPGRRGDPAAWDTARYGTASSFEGGVSAAWRVRTGPRRRSDRCAPASRRWRSWSTTTGRSP